MENSITTGGVHNKNVKNEQDELAKFINESIDKKNEADRLRDEDRKAADRKAADIKVADRKADDRKADDRKADDRKADDRKADDIKAADAKAAADRDRKIADRKASELLEFQARQTKEKEKAEKTAAAPAAVASTEKVAPVQITDSVESEKSSMGLKPSDAFLAEHRDANNQAFERRQAELRREQAIAPTEFKRETIKKQAEMESHRHLGQQAALDKNSAAHSHHTTQAELLKTELLMRQEPVKVSLQSKTDVEARQQRSQDALMARTETRNNAAASANQAAGQVTPPQRTLRRAAECEKKLVQRVQQRSEQKIQVTSKMEKTL